MWFKTSKDRLIEVLQAELDIQRNETARLREDLRTLLLTPVPQPEQVNKPANDPAKPRTMTAYVQRLSEQSYRRAAAKGRNLVAEFAPPGAHKPSA